MSWIDHELQTLETIHNFSIGYDKKAQTMDVVLLILILTFAIPACAVAGIDAWLDGRKVVYWFELFLVAANVANTVWTIQRIWKRRKSTIREQELYEAARKDLLALKELEENYDVVLQR